MTPGIEIERIRSFDKIGPVLELVSETETELVFSAADFLLWAREGISHPNAMVGLVSVGRDPAAFFVAFGPWPLDRHVFVLQAYILPEWRNTAVLQAGLDYLRHWQKETGACGIAFQTRRPRPWMRMLKPMAKRTFYNVVMEV